jgi:hypothetical protein
MLPGEVRGVELRRWSHPASLLADGGGDLCTLACPDEPGRLAAAAGLTVDDIVLGYAVPDDMTDVPLAILAVRLRGVGDRNLVDVRLRAGGHTALLDGLPPDAVTLRVGDRTVTRVTWPPFYDPRQGEYLTAVGDVLFIVFGEPPAADGTVPRDIRLAIEALPRD